MAVKTVEINGNEFLIQGRYFKKLEYDVDGVGSDVQTGDEFAELDSIMQQGIELIGEVTTSELSMLEDAFCKVCREGDEPSEEDVDHDEDEAMSISDEYDSMCAVLEAKLDGEANDLE